MEPFEQCDTYNYCKYIYIYIYIFFLGGKKDATTFSRQACFVNRFTNQACQENVVVSFFPPKIFIPLRFNVLSTVPRDNRLADSLYIYIYIYISEDGMSWRGCV